MELFSESEGEYAFSTTSSSLPGVTRQYQNSAQCTEEICWSRVYGGIHFQVSNEAGRDLGERIANFTFSRYLLPRR